MARGTRPIRGFTLIEVMVALLVIALGVGALLTTLVSAADASGYLRDKSFAQWVALNRISELRLSTGRQQPGVSRDTVQFAGSIWQYEQEISEAGIGGLLRVDVRVARVDEPRAGADIGAAGISSDAEEFASLGSAIGFIGATPTRGSGLTPDWSPRAPSGRDGDGDGDGDDNRDGQQDLRGPGPRPGGAP